MAGKVIRAEKVNELPRHIGWRVGGREQRRPGDGLRLGPFGSGAGRYLAGGHVSLQKLRLLVIETISDVH